MSNLLFENAFNILGLDSASSQKVVNKRAKDIISLLKIDELPPNVIDIKIAPSGRSEGSVKISLQKLSSPTKRVREYFFWFDAAGELDEKAFDKVIEGKYDEAAELWAVESKKETAHGYIAKKNLAILSSILLTSESTNKHLSASLNAWKDIVHSEKFWKHFGKIYALNDEIGTSQTVLNTFKSQVANDLSDLYSDISHVKDDKSIYSSFTRAFGVKGQKMQDGVLGPIFEKINDASDKLKSLNISDDNIISPEEVTELQRLIKILQKNFQELKDLGLFDDSQAKIMRDKAAEAIRVVALDLYNNLNETKKPVALFSIASKIAGTTGLQQKINKEIVNLKDSIAIDKIVQPINELLETEQYSEALDMIFPLRGKYKNDKQLTSYFDQRVQWCVASIASDSLIQSKDLYENEKYSQAAEQFENTRAFVEMHLKEYDISPKWVNDTITHIEGMLSTVSSDSISSASKLRDQIVDKSAETFEGKPEYLIVVTLIDCTIYKIMAQKIPSLKRKNVANSVLSTIGSWIVWLVILAIIGGIASAFGGGESSDDSSPSSSPSSSSSSSAYDVCSVEYDALKAQLDDVESRMNSYKDYDTDSYNSLVPEQNDLVSQLNAKAAECNGL
jgi:hypothetical protein